MARKPYRVGIFAISLFMSTIPSYSADDFFKINNKDSVQYTVCIYENSMTGQRPGFWHGTVDKFYIDRNYSVVVPAGKVVGFDTAWVKAKIENQYDHIYKIVLEGGSTPKKEISVRSIKANFAYKFLHTNDAAEDEPERNWHGLHGACTIVIKDKALTLSPK